MSFVADSSSWRRHTSTCTAGAAGLQNFCIDLHVIYILNLVQRADGPKEGYCTQRPAVMYGSSKEQAASVILHLKYTHLELAVS